MDIMVFTCWGLIDWFFRSWTNSTTNAFNGVRVRATKSHSSWRTNGTSQTNQVCQGAAKRSDFSSTSRNLRKRTLSMWHVWTCPHCSPILADSWVWWRVPVQYHSLNLLSGSFFISLIEFIWIWDTEGRLMLSTTRNSSVHVTLLVNVGRKIWLRLKFQQTENYITSENNINLFYR